MASGLVAWVLIATAGNLLLRLAWPAYAAVEKAISFTLGMLTARLALGAMSSLGAGFAVAWLTRRNAVAAWSKFPAWYHVLFIASLVLFTLLGAMRRLPR